MNTYEILHSPFDVKTHKENFIDYLEVVILEDGTIEYAVPSHTAKLEGLIGETDEEPWLDYFEWLTYKSGAIAVWNDFYHGRANDAQLASLEMLKREGLYKGNVVE